MTLDAAGELFITDLGSGSLLIPMISISSQKIAIHTAKRLHCIVLRDDSFIHP